jgi:hypothetical protein
MMATRLCKYCGLEKFYDSTAKPQSKASGFMGAKCWTCRLATNSLANKIWQSKFPEKAKAAKDVWYAANPGKRKEINAAWHAANPGAHAQQVRAYYCRKDMRTPSWANLAAIKEIYRQAAIKGLAVDHVIPLHGELVSGLHVENNLQLLSNLENSRKSNMFDPENN